MRPEILCAEHCKPVSLAKGEPLICHQNGSYCGSQQFTAETLNRGQAMALMILAAGWQAMNPQDSP